MNMNQPFADEITQRVASYREDYELQEKSRAFFQKSLNAKYSYNFTWLGRPIIQYPQDILALQEIIWLTQPDLIIETGIAHGGSIIFSASMLALLELCSLIEKGKVVAVDIDIRKHNLDAIQQHPLHNKIHLIEGSSISPNIIEQVRHLAQASSRILVCLDSNHTHEHVLAELNAYAPLVSVGSYCIVMDTIIEDLPESSFPDRAWGPGNSPKTAIQEFIRSEDLRDYSGHPMHFESDDSIVGKLLFSVAPGGYLKRDA